MSSQSPLPADRFAAYRVRIASVNRLVDGLSLARTLPPLREGADPLVEALHLELEARLTGTVFAVFAEIRRRRGADGLTEAMAEHRVPPLATLTDLGEWPEFVAIADRHDRVRAGEHGAPDPNDVEALVADYRERITTLAEEDDTAALMTEIRQDWRLGDEGTSALLPVLQEQAATVLLAATQRRYLAQLVNAIHDGSATPERRAALKQEQRTLTAVATDLFQETLAGELTEPVDDERWATRIAIEQLIQDANRPRSR